MKIKHIMRLTMLALLVLSTNISFAKSKGKDVEVSEACKKCILKCRIDGMKCAVTHLEGILEGSEKVAEKCAETVFKDCHAAECMQDGVCTKKEFEAAAKMIPFKKVENAVEKEIKNVTTGKEGKEKPEDKETTKDKK